MAKLKLPELVVDHLRDAHAMEHTMRNVLRSVMVTTRDAAMLRVYEEIDRAMKAHADQVEERLRQLDEHVSIVAEAGAAATSYVQGMAVRMRGMKPAKNARDVYVLLQLTVAGYELLGRIAERAGDPTTASLVRRIGQSDLTLANRLSQWWDHVIDLSLGAPPNAGAGGVSGAAEGGSGGNADGDSDGGDAAADLGLGLPGEIGSSGTVADLESPRRDVELPRGTSGA